MWILRGLLFGGIIAVAAAILGVPNHVIAVGYVIGHIHRSIINCKP